MAWYEVKNAAMIDSPALLLYPDRMRRNIRKAIGIVGEVKRLRPHVKTNKIAEVCRMMMEEGIEKFKCATIAEAEMLGSVGAADVLMAYQPGGPKIRRLVELAGLYPKTSFSCMADNERSVQEINEAFEGAGSIGVFIDVNTGMNRTGAAPEAVSVLFQKITGLKNLLFRGLHGYDGHISDTDFALRKERSDLAFGLLKKTADEIEKISGSTVSMVAGGSPTFPIHARREGVECSPGTFVFWDQGYSRLKEQDFEFAGLVMTRIISIVDGQTITTDLGHKSVAAENPLPRVLFLNDGEIVTLSQSEEHLVAAVSDSSQYQVGDILYGIAYHICPTVALYETGHVIEDGLRTGEWRVVARDRKISV